MGLCRSPPFAAAATDRSMLHDWLPYSDVLPALTAVAEARERQKQNYASSRQWASGSTHLIGIIGEWRYGLAIGEPPDLRLLASGDDGSDFHGVDVKCSTYLPNPDLKVNPEDFDKGARAFALVVVHQELELACFAGWASARELREAPLKNYGHGPKHALNWRKLHAGTIP